MTATLAASIGALDVEDPQAGRLTELTMISVSHGPVDLLVYTPPGYFLAGNTERFPVIYWLHGSGGNHLSLKTPLESLPTSGFDGAEKLDALIESDPAVSALIMVGIAAPAGDWDAAALDLVSREVPAFVDHHFRTIARRAGRGLEGFSLGSEGVSRYVTERPDVFATASLLGGGFLPALWTASQAAILRDKLEVAQFVGDQDAFQTDASILAAELDSLGVPNEFNLLGGVGHSPSQIYAAGGPQILAFHSDRWRRAEVVDAGPDQEIDAPFPVATSLDGAVSDPEGVLGAFTTRWEQVSGPAPAVLGDASSLSTTVTLPQAGTYFLRLVADGDVERCDVVRVVAVHIDASLEMHLTFDGGDGADASGNGRVGTLSGGPVALVDGRVGGALGFDGQDDAVIVSDFDYGDAWTISLWMRANDLTGGGYQYVASHNGFDLQPSLNFYLPEDVATRAEDPADLLTPDEPAPAERAGGSPGRVRAAVRDGDDGPGQFSTAPAPVDDGAWHHLILTVPEVGGHRVYVDGVDLAGGSHGGGAFDPPGDLFFGGRSVAPAGRYFFGDLDEIRLYSRGLLPEEVAVLAAQDDTDASPAVDAGDDLTVYQPG
ncbi:MAG: LamG-like jellyroll fold domain-containing protein, partial [Acidobacteriota bacterium]